MLPNTAEDINPVLQGISSLWSIDDIDESQIEPPMPHNMCNDSDMEDVLKENDNVGLAVGLNSIKQKSNTPLRTKK